MATCIMVGIVTYCIVCTQSRLAIYNEVIDNILAVNSCFSEYALGHE